MSEQEQIDIKIKIFLEKQNEIIKCLEGVSIADCKSILSSVTNELSNISFVKTNN